MEYENITLPVIGFNGKKVADTVLPGDIFNAKINKYAVQMQVRVDLSNRRVSTAHVLTRDIVNGSNKKPWRQKGTGRARSGTANSPVWRHGGVVHGPNGLQNYKIKMNKKEAFIAYASVLTEKVQNKNIIVLTDAKFTSNKTKDFINTLKLIKADEKKNLLIVPCDNPDENLILAARNIPSVKIVPSDNVSVYDVLNANKVIYVNNAIPSLIEDDEINE